MAVFNASTADGHLRCSNATYSTARDGTGTFATVTAATDNQVGQELFGGVYYCYELFWDFDTSSIPSGATIVSATLEGYVVSTNITSSGAGVVRARVYDWSTSVTTADWIAGASVSGQTLVAHTVAMSSLTGSAYNTFVDDALAANINKGGVTRFILTSDRFEAGTVPTGAPNGSEYASFSSADGANPPKLTVTWTVDGVYYISTVESERTGTTDPHTFSATIDANAKGCVLLIGHGTSSTDHVPSSATVTVGGVAMAYVASATDTATEPGRVDAWFLGSGLPSAGSQTVSVDLASATTDDMHFVFIQLGGATDLEVVDSDTVNENATNPSVTLSYGGRTCISVGMLYSGTATVGTSTTPNANMTNVALFDIAAFGTSADRQTTPGTADFTFSYTSAADDVAMVALAVSQVQAATWPGRRAITTALQAIARAGAW